MKKRLYHLAIAAGLAICPQLQANANGLFPKSDLQTGKSAMTTPQDSVAALTERVRQGDVSAYLKLADCYCYGYGVKRDFLCMVTMATLAMERGYINNLDQYFNCIPDRNEYKALWNVMSLYQPYMEETTDSVLNELKNIGGAYAMAFAGTIMTDKGDSIAGREMITEAARQGCVMAEILLTEPYWNVNQDTVNNNLRDIAERAPIVYNVLGDRYFEPDKDGNTDKPLAIELYMKAEKHAVLGKTGARRVLAYYRDGGNINLSEDDVKRLEIIVGSNGSDQEQSY